MKEDIPAGAEGLNALERRDFDRRRAPQPVRKKVSWHKREALRPKI